MLTHRAIEANLEKCKAITEMRNPTSVKEIQRLIGCLTTVSRFVPKLTERTKPIVQLLWKASKFKWTDECEEIILQLKTFLAFPPVIQKPVVEEPIVVYLAVSEDAINAVLVEEIDIEEQPVYFIIKVLHGAEVRYQTIEKVALALVITA